MEFRFDPYVIAVNVASHAALEERVRTRLARREGFALATINLDHLVKLDVEPAFRSAYADQDFVVADGNPIVWLSKIAGSPVELVAGSDAVLPLAQLAAEAGVSIALVGSTPRALDGAATVLEQRIPGLTVALKISPPFGFDPHSEVADEVLEAVARSGAGLCFIALGAPKQEIFAARGRKLAPQVGFASIGAGLDFLVGDQVRAPAWVRRLTLEWLWRAAHSPRRLVPRYARCALVLPKHGIAALRLRQRTLRNRG